MQLLLPPGGLPIVRIELTLLRLSCNFVLLLTNYPDPLNGTSVIYTMVVIHHMTYRDTTFSSRHGYLHLDFIICNV